MPYTIAANTAPVASMYTEQIMSMHDVFKPQAIPTLFARFGNQYMPMFQIFRSLGREEAIAGDEWFGWEENWYHATVHLVLADPSTPPANPGDPAWYLLDDADVDAKLNSYPRVGNVITAPGTFDQYYVKEVEKNVLPHRLLLIPVLKTTLLPDVQVSTEMVISTNAFGAGTGQPQSTVLGSTKKSFIAQIFKETIGAEGSQLVNEKWYKVMDNGKSVKGWYSPGYMRGEYLMALAMDGAFTWGEETDLSDPNLTVPGTEPGGGNIIKTTKGIMRHATEEGFGLDYDETAFEITDFDQVGLYYKSQGITSAFSMGWLGNRFMNTIENSLVDYLKNTGVDYTTVVNSVFKGDKDLAVSVGFSVLKKGGITHILKPMDAWSNPKVFGAAGYDMDKWGLFTPLASFTDPKTKKKLDNIATRYRAMDGYSRRFETWTVQGAGNGLKVIDIDKTNTYFRSHLGLQVFKANQFVVAKPQ